MSGYISSLASHNEDTCEKRPFLLLTPWTVQNIAYEVITNFFLANTPASLGFAFTQAYDADKNKTTIFVDISSNYTKSVASKRPAVFIGREDVDHRIPTLQGMIETDTQNSSSVQLMMNAMMIKVSCIGTSLGITEELASYTSQALTSFRQQIKADFRLREWKLVKTSAPQLLPEPADHHVVTLLVQTNFDNNYQVQRDDLRIKTIGREIFDGISGKAV